MSEDVCLECGSPTYSEVCKGCLLQIRNATEKMWRQAGVEPQDIAGWVNAGFGPYSAPAWISAGHGPAEARRFRLAGIRISTAVAWSRAGFSALEAEGWRDAEFTLEEASSWTERGYGFEDAEEWREAGNDPVLADAWILAGFTVEEAEDWIAEGIAIPRAIDLSEQGEVPNDASGWGEVPFQERGEWRACNVEPVDANAWTPLIDRLGGVGTHRLAWSAVKPVDGLTVKEAQSWIANGFSAERTDTSYFEPFRDAGLAPSEATRFLELLARSGSIARRPPSLFDLTYGAPLFDEIDVEENAGRIRALASYEANGVPWTVETIRRWQLLPAESILEAVDLGYDNAFDYLRFDGLGIPADDAVRLSEMVDDDTQAIEALWLAEQLGIPAEEAMPWISYGFESSEIQAWTSLGIDPFTAADWCLNNFDAATAIGWLNAGITVASSAAAWRDASFVPEVASDWIHFDGSAAEAARWALAGIEPFLAARRRAAGLVPPPLP